MARKGGGGARLVARLVARVRASYALAYVALLGAALALGFASWPIVAADTDLWYHLNAGRYIASAQALPQTAFFSFLQPTPTGLDYYWLAQLLFYGVHSLAGYLGLVELRALVALGTYALVLATLRLGKGRSGWGASAIFFTLAALFLVGRLTMVRPCDLSYLALAAFLFILESRRGLVALPVLALLWMNLHGIEYPVMLLALGAYLGEWLLARLGWLPNVSAPPWPAFAAPCVALLAVLATPHPFALLAAPFAPLAFASQYIQELRPVDASALLTLRVDGLYVSRQTFLSLLLGASVVAALASLRRGSVRPAHLALLAGGLFLLLRSERFSAEFVLLVIPLLGALQPRRAEAPAVPEALRAALVAVLAVFALWHLHAVLATRCQFPLCARDLPEGSVAFLARVGASGAVLNHPNQGGYLEWELYPRQRIFADLQTPFLFSDLDVYVAQQAFRDPVVLEGLVSEYHPAFLLVPKTLPAAGAWIGRVADYAPVFSDDASVLYASAAAQPELVARYRLTAIEPFALEVAGDASDPQVLARAAAEIARVNALHPAGASARVLEGALALRRGDAEAALRIADDVARRHPERADAHGLRGDALLRLERFADAAEAYRAALASGDDERLAGMTFHLASRLFACESRLGRREAAYRALRGALGDLYRASVGYRELALLAGAALDAGRTQEGQRLLEFALEKTPESEAGLRRTLEARLRSLSPGGGPR